MSAKDIRNIVLLGHSGSGKTTLAESMLYLTGGTDRLGRIADGNTVCDYDPEEIRRQISISLAVAPVEYDSCKINVLDVPGGFDFAGEVAEAVQAADAAVIVCSAKAGMSVGAEKAWKYCEKNSLPRLLYISKTDEENSDYNAAFNTLRERFGKNIAPVVAPIWDESKKVIGIIDVLHKRAFEFGPGGGRVEIEVPENKKPVLDELYDALKESVAETSEEFMEKFFAGEDFTYAEMIHGLRQGVKDLSLFPVVCGSAIQGMGTRILMDTIVELLPQPQDARALMAENEDGESSEFVVAPGALPTAFVFKTISDQYGKYSYVKVLSGSIKPDMPMVNARTGETEKLGRLYIPKGKKYTEVKELTCGDIGAIAKMDKVKTGDTLCEPRKVVKIEPIPFDEPCYSVAIAPKTRGQEDKMAQGLNRLNEEDPSFRVVNNAETHQMVVSGVCPPQLSGSETAPLTVGTVDSIDAARFAGFCYAALGHIHRAQRVGIDAVRYAGSPLCYHLDECGAQKSVTLVRIGKRGVEKIEPLPLTPRRAMRHLTGPLAKLVEHPTDTEDYIWATLTDPTPLPDAMAQLRAAYPNAMRLDYQPQGAAALPADMTQAVRGKPFAELFQDFFTKMNGRPLTTEEVLAVKKLREEASKIE